jgi:hypothetical protein
MNASKNIRFIAKTNTNLAIAFLKSCFGKRLESMNNFRIISDMTRENEKDSGNAGANFMKAINRDFKDIKKLVFTSSKSEGIKKIESKGVDLKSSNIEVTHEDSVARKFVYYDD